MKRRIPAQTVEVCDICGRDGYLQTCLACGGRYCLLHNAYISGCIHSCDVCRKCSDDKRVIAVARKFAPRITRILKLRDAEFKALKIKYKKPHIT